MLPVLSAPRAGAWEVTPEFQTPFFSSGALGWFCGAVPSSDCPDLEGHEEEVAELCPVGDAVPGLGAAQCQSHSKGSDSVWIFLCKDGAFPAMSGVVHTPGFPLETELGMKSQIAAAPRCNSLPKPSARPGRVHRAALGSSGLNSSWDPKPLSASGCAHTPVSLRAQEQFPFPGSRPCHFHTSTGHRASGIPAWQEGGAW